MHNECLLELYHRHLTDNARRALEVVIEQEEVTMETIMVTARLTTQQTRRGVWGLACTGLICYNPGRPVRLSENGHRLAQLLQQGTKGEPAR